MNFNYCSYFYPYWLILVYKLVLFQINKVILVYTKQKRDSLKAVLRKRKTNKY